MDQLFIATSKIEAPAEEVFRWHEEPGALERLTPRWQPVEIEQRPTGIRDGDRAILRIGFGPFKIRWVLEHRDYVAGRQFRDVQISGPFHRWQHTHSFLPQGPRNSILEDRIEYALPFAPVGALLGNWFVLRKLKRLFDYRHPRYQRGAGSPRSIVGRAKRPTNG